MPLPLSVFSFQPLALALPSAMSTDVSAAAAAMATATKVALLSAGVFFMVGLLTGVWKYLAIRRSAEAQAPVYVDAAHRAALLYSFAALLLARFTELSPFSDAVTLLATLAPLAFFAFAITTYVIHGVLRDTDNQLERPHRLGRHVLPPVVIAAFMWMLIIAEIGGFAVLFAGVCMTLF